MSKVKRGVAVAGAVAVVAVAAFFLLGNRSVGDIPGLGALAPEDCPLSGVEAKNEALLERPAVAVKVENNPVAYPLSGLERAEVVYEERVEGGATRFMAIYHCSDARKVGPIRSARLIDPAALLPITRILAFSGGNAHVLAALEEADVVMVEEDGANEALTRIPREGISFEHTLYGDTVAVRRVGRKTFAEPPPDDMFEHGDLEGKSRKARSISLDFGMGATITYSWNGDEWLRFDSNLPLVSESGQQIGVDNVLIEEHEYVESETIKDVTGAASVEITDITGSGRAVLFRDGRAIVGRWRRESVEGAVRFETKAGDTMVLAPGSTWIELVPSPRGEVKGSFTYAK